MFRVLLIFSLLVSNSSLLGQERMPEIDSLVKWNVELHSLLPQNEPVQSGIVYLLISKTNDSISIQTKFSSYGSDWAEGNTRFNLRKSINGIRRIMPNGYKILVPIEYHCSYDSVIDQYHPDAESSQIIRDLLAQYVATTPIIVDLNTMGKKRIQIQ